VLFWTFSEIIIIISESHLAATTLAAGAAADKAAANKEMKYSVLASTHIFFPVAFETSGVMNRLQLTWSQRLADVSALSQKTPGRPCSCSNGFL